MRLPAKKVGKRVKYAAPREARRAERLESTDRSDRRVLSPSAPKRTPASNGLDQISLQSLRTADAAAFTRVEAQRADIFQAMMTSLHSDGRPDHFETRAGFTVEGADARRALLGPAATARNLFGNAWRIEPILDQDTAIRQASVIRQPLPLIVELRDGRFVGSAALPEFLLSFTIDEFGAQAIIYRPMNGGYVGETETVMAKLRASGLAGSQAPEIVMHLRSQKHADPMLGVLAAYLHDAAGDIANVHRTAYFFATKKQAIPFDIALLGRLEVYRDKQGHGKVRIPAVPDAPDTGDDVPGYMRRATPAAEGTLAGAFPWLRQGWARLDPEGRPDFYPAGLDNIAGHLLPAPFTTLDAKGGRELARQVFGEVQ